MLSKLTLFDPDKFCGGLGCLWRGYCPLLSVSFYKYLFSGSTVFSTNLLTFFSARKSIYWILCCHRARTPWKRGVIVSLFTCDAVINAIKEADCYPIYIKPNSDFSFNLDHLSTLIDSDVLVIILQHTLGSTCISFEDMPDLASFNLPIIHDFCLSPGVDFEHWKPYVASCSSQYIVCSFEYSKSIILGQGGCVYASESSISFLTDSGYSSSKQSSFLLQIRLLIGTFLASSLSRFGIPLLGSIIWAFLVAFGFILRSNSLPPSRSNIIRPGYVFHHLILYSFSILPKILVSQNTCCRQIFRASQFSMNIHFCNLSLSSLANFSSPRIAFLVPIHDKDSCIVHFSSYGIKLGTWFNSSPDPDLYANCFSDLSHHNIPMYCFNLPSYATLTKYDLNRLCLAIKSY